MGWGRHTTDDIMRLMMIAVVAVVIGTALPLYVHLRDFVVAFGVELQWYHHVGLMLAAGAGGVLFVLAIGGLLFALEHLIDRNLNRHK